MRLAREFATCGLNGVRYAVAAIGETSMKSNRKSGRRTVLAGAAFTGSLAILSAHEAAAQTVEPNKPQDEALQEVTVTASRRKTDIVEIPYNISAYSAAALEANDVKNLAYLAQQVPGFTLENRGARDVAASVPIIRGLNASSPDRGGAVQVSEQSPVATYLGNTPVQGYFPIEDIQRVEVLRGPQGTLYGAGSLGGAIRLIPNDPELNTWAGNITATGSNTDHADTPGYSGSGLLNAPIGDIAAFRLSAKYDFQPGFIKQIGIMETNPATGAPLLANPADVANSPGIYYSRSGVNFTKVTSARASLLVKPADALSIDIAFNTATLSGDGSPRDNPHWGGGPSPIDPRITFPATGDYQVVQPTLEPYHRRSDLATADLSYDIGFATLSSTTSYFDTNGQSQDDNTFGFLTTANAAGYGKYYSGVPASPRFIQPNRYYDREHNFTQELRLVSAQGKTLDYVIGLYYERSGRQALWDVTAPGVAEQSVASGSPITVFDDGAGVIGFIRNSHQFTDKSVFGELTWHLTDRWEATFGGREFRQQFQSREDYISYTLGINVTGTNSTATTDHIVKANTSYEYVPGHRVYATYSQGFRRGGANGFPLTGLAQEPDVLRYYKPDKVDNYEVGFKGRFENGMRYTADVFNIIWNDPQIGVLTTVGNIVAVNAPKARSRGVEFELTTPLFVPRLDLTLGFAYTDAQLTESFCLPDGDGSGAPNGFIPCAIQGTAGDRMPGSPKTVGSATLAYRQPIPGNGYLIYTLNDNYKSSINLALGNSAAAVPSYSLMNASVTWAMQQHWRVGAYSNNLLGRRAVFSMSSNPLIYNNSLDNRNIVSQPREVGVRVAYDF
jgi:iron complex outermembrane recepter protein